MKTNEQIEIRLNGMERWNPARVILASANGLSIAVEMERGVVINDGGGAFVNIETGRVTLLLMAEKNGRYRDVANPKRQYIIRPAEAQTPPRVSRV